MNPDDESHVFHNPDEYRVFHDHETGRVTIGLPDAEPIAHVADVVIAQTIADALNNRADVEAALEVLDDDSLTVEQDQRVSALFQARAILGERNVSPRTSEELLTVARWISSGDLPEPKWEHIRRPQRDAAASATKEA